jgi:ribonuclease D
MPAEFQRPISREEVNELPIRRYEGEVCLVEGPRDLERAAADLLQEAVVGFDTETRPAFKVGQSYPPALAQAATAQRVYLFPLLRVDCSAVLRELLSSERTVKAGVGLSDDLRALDKSFETKPKSLVDLSTIAKRHGVKKTGVRTLAALFLGFRIPKGTKTSNWAAPRLSPQQVTYAATDAWACRELYLRFRELGLL